eukprot:CAMPEP_0203828960 /NCGR_PEP_ID=MMETSP0115-20131106/62408_1 /ASSEMBLY_ACC=CAM_ASM_000227 /TAXON_ID=33651 /ORGANISM="Bicosoecid sp, Strain ms1" /LENGTH=313 /DNA_ID=CAMNT_0050738025 /DNA_START=129 /DNA_END=1066 /DNA_ORIENTATION=+
MKFLLDGLQVYFPYPYVYSEQLKYMRELKRALDVAFAPGVSTTAKGHCMLEMPTGTGKTVALLSLITSYQLAHPTVGKLMYCTRTVPEMTKCVGELKRVIEYRVKELGPEGGNVLACCLSSRRNMCIHERVMAEADREQVDAACRKRTAPWVREKVAERAKAGVRVDEVEEACTYFEAFERVGTDAAIPMGIYGLDDLKKLGKEKGWCPYFLTRHCINLADVIVYNYQYLLDPKIATMVSRELESDSIVVFDEAHNIDNVCIEALSITLDKRMLDTSLANIDNLKRQVSNLKESDRRRLTDEYERLVRGLAGT